MRNKGFIMLSTEK